MAYAFEDGELYQATPSEVPAQAAAPHLQTPIRNGTLTVPALRLGFYIHVRALAQQGGGQKTS